MDKKDGGTIARLALARKDAEIAALRARAERAEGRIADVNDAGSNVANSLVVIAPP